MSNRKQHIDSNHKPKYSASMHQHCTFELRTYKVAPEHAATRSSEKQKDRWTISPSKVPITLPAATLPANTSMSKFMSKADMSDWSGNISLGGRLVKKMITLNRMQHVACVQWCPLPFNLSNRGETFFFYCSALHAELFSYPPVFSSGTAQDPRRWYNQQRRSRGGQVCFLSQKSWHWSHHDGQLAAGAVDTHLIMQRHYNKCIVC